jgi:hypothetical protein
MLMNVAAGAYSEGIRMANQFIMHLEILFKSLDLVQSKLPQTTLGKLFVFYIYFIRLK